MVYKVLVVLVFLLFPSFVHAVEKVVSLEDLGHAKDVYLSGTNPEFSLYLSNYRGLKTAKAQMQLRLSHVLDKKSTVTVLVNDVPLFTKSVEQIGHEPTLSFGIKLSSSDYVKVAVRGSLFITGDICHDIPTGNLWMVVSNKSRFIMENTFISDNISSYFKNYDADFNIVLDNEKVSLSAIPLIYYINKLNYWKNINISIINTPIEGMRNIIVGNYDRDIEIRDGNLFVSGNGIQMLKKSLMNLYITSSLRNSLINTEEANRTKELSLANAGIRGITMTGIGDLSFNVPIRYSFFSGIPRNLNLKLMLNHTPIPEGDKAFLKIFLNGVLIKAEQLSGGGNITSYTVKIPEEFLKGYNNDLNIVVSYFINRGDCKGSIPSMTVSMLDSSYFYYDDVSRKKINTVTDVMGSMSGKVLVMIDDHNMLNFGIYLMDILGRFNRDIENIDIIQTNYKKEKMAGYDFVILLANPINAHEPNMPLKLNQGRFSIVNPLTQKELFNLEQRESLHTNEIISSEYADSFGILQTFDEGDSKILMLSYYNDINKLSFLEDIKKEDINKMLGNVVVFNRDIASYEIGEKYRVIYKDVKTLGYYWNKFKLVMVLVIGLIVMAFLYLVNKKLVRG
ncbi:MAG TPA: cellulose biosynthesis cyclic di-GMP-binding regulatory protein BcsB [Nitrospinota bacterium]|nr:cellulose biosynthesis cyclic di-GMP-binding regulatory protein BcsB [Nitrospinota bacterium]